jgi:hypothetical protein
MSFNGAHSTFNQYDVNRGGYNHQQELNLNNGNSAGAVEYQSSLYNTSGYGLDPSLINNGLSGYDSSLSYAGGVGDAGGLSNYEASLGYGSSNGSGAQTYPTDAQGLYLDPNPIIIRRSLPVNEVSYKQRVIIRYLQPPPIPPPGVIYLFLILFF